MKITVFILSLISLLFVILILTTCKDAGKKEISEEQSLARTHCSTCHMFVPAELLDSITWADHVLPAMAPKLGIGVWNKTQYFQGTKNDDTGLSFEDWNKIVKYYQTGSPDSLPLALPPERLIEDWSIFKPVLPQKNGGSGKATTSLVKIDSQNGSIYSGDATTPRLIQWNNKLVPESEWRLPSPPVNLFFDKERSAIVTCIGTLSGRNLNLLNGQIISFQEHFKGNTEVLFSGLPRPVQTTPIDVDNDGLKDWLVAGFGHDTGGLILLHQKDKGVYKEEMVYDMPGAEQIVVDDFNGDGWPDMMVLFAQAREGIWLFTNNKNGGFDNRNILEFPPVYGSTSFQLTDFNGDGKPDILYTCGDNADFSSIFKPYHGVYIFLNKGDFRFEQTYFYPINGCTKAVAKDFDGDGNPDIAAIAYFADPDKSPPESFIYFEGRGSLEFIPHSLPISQYGRWISMDVGDVNGDGTPDIILGNFSGGFGRNPKFSNGKVSGFPIILLENQSK